MGDMTSDFRAALASLAEMSEGDRADLQSRLCAGLPAEHLPWPFGMPTSAAPRIIAIGASPGNSPPASGLPTSSSGLGAYDPPTFGDPHHGFYCEDTKHYWSKVRRLLADVGRCLDSSATPECALALSGHFNLGTGMAGTATSGVVEPRILTWLSGLLGSVLPAEVVVCFGVNRILASPAKSTLWNEVLGGLRVDWRRPQRFVPFDRYRFRLWDAVRADGQRVLLCMWPNHPSRHPFTGPAQSTKWLSAVRTFCDILRGGATHGVWGQS